MEEPINWLIAEFVAESYRIDTMEPPDNDNLKLGTEEFAVWTSAEIQDTDFDAFGLIFPWLEMPWQEGVPGFRRFRHEKMTHVVVFIEEEHEAVVRAFLREKAHLFSIVKQADHEYAKRWFPHYAL